MAEDRAVTARQRQAWWAVGRSPHSNQRCVVPARTGVPWPDLPERYGPWQTVYERHRRWSADGTWRQILGELQIEADATDPDGALAKAAEEESAQSRREWAVNIDSTSCRAHQHAAGARHRPPRDFPQKGAVHAWRRMAGRRWGARGAD